MWVNITPPVVYFLFSFPSVLGGNAYLNSINTTSPYAQKLKYEFPSGTMGTRKTRKLKGTSKA